MNRMLREPTHCSRWIVLLTSTLALLALLLVTLPGRSFGASAVTTATPIASPTPAATDEPDLAERIDARLSKVADADRFNGAVLIAKDGEVILSKGYGLANRELDVPMTAQSKFRIGSLTSLFTALATMRLVQEGAIALGDSICDYLDDCPEAWQPITIDHLLARTSGLAPLESIPNSATVRKAGATPQRLLAIYQDLPLTSTPGKAWNYSAMSDILLGTVIGKQGTPFGTFVQENILDPLEMADTGLDNGSRLLAGRADGYASSSTRASYVDIATMGAAGAMYSTVEDLYRLVQGVTGGAILSDT
ncbi:MAG TPA: serine hydrolase domain-containing protein, partial [Anaerolineae bacterium]|nr:serine hydrolase domain-containing protein [Anaerolineae bacterium]